MLIVVAMVLSGFGLVQPASEGAPVTGAIFTSLDDGLSHDFHDLLNVIDMINNNNKDPGYHVLSPDP